jgi:hypothetical protein
MIIAPRIQGEVDAHAEQRLTSALAEVGAHLYGCDVVEGVTIVNILGVDDFDHEGRVIAAFNETCAELGLRRP